MIREVKVNSLSIELLGLTGVSPKANSLSIELLGLASRFPDSKHFLPEPSGL